MDILSNSLKYGNKTLSNIAKTGNPVEIENKFDRLFYMQEMSKKGNNPLFAENGTKVGYNEMMILIMQECLKKYL